MTKMPWDDLTIGVWFTQGIFKNGSVDTQTLGQPTDPEGGLAQFVKLAKAAGTKGQRFVAAI